MRWVDGTVFKDNCICLTIEPVVDAKRIINYLLRHRIEFVCERDEYECGIYIDADTNLDHLRRKVPGAKFTIAQ